jgi:hypothetical protein
MTAKQKSQEYPQSPDVGRLEKMEEAYLSVPNWEEYQHYTKRSPPWIKLHNKLIEDYDFECLPDASKAHLVLIWLLASRCNNKIKPDAKWIARKIGATEPVNLMKLIEAKFLIENGDVAKCLQDASKVLVLAEREESRAEERREEKSLVENPPVEPPPKKPKTKTPRDLADWPEKPGFNDFWKAYPKKVDKKKCIVKWKTRKLDEKAGEIIQDINIRKAQHRPWLEGFIPSPLRFIDGEKWDDEIEQINNHNNQYSPTTQQNIQTAQEWADDK